MDISVLLTPILAAAIFVILKIAYDYFNAAHLGVSRYGDYNPYSQASESPRGLSLFRTRSNRSPAQSPLNTTQSTSNEITFQVPLMGRALQFLAFKFFKDDHVLDVLTHHSGKLRLRLELTVNDKLSNRMLRAMNHIRMTIAYVLREFEYNAFKHDDFEQAIKEIQPAYRKQLVKLVNRFIRTENLYTETLATCATEELQTLITVAHSLHKNDEVYPLSWLKKHLVTLATSLHLIKTSDLSVNNESIRTADKMASPTLCTEDIAGIASVMTDSFNKASKLTPTTGKWVNRSFRTAVKNTTLLRRNIRLVYKRANPATIAAMDKKTESTVHGRVLTDKPIITRHPANKLRTINAFTQMKPERAHEQLLIARESESLNEVDIHSIHNLNTLVQAHRYTISAAILKVAHSITKFEPVCAFRSLYRHFQNSQRYFREIEHLSWYFNPFSTKLAMAEFLARPKINMAESESSDGMSDTEAHKPTKSVKLQKKSLNDELNATSSDDDLAEPEGYQITRLTTYKFRPARKTTVRAPNNDDDASTSDSNGSEASDHQSESSEQGEISIDQSLFGSNASIQLTDSPKQISEEISARSDNENDSADTPLPVKSRLSFGSEPEDAYQNTVLGQFDDNDNATQWQNVEIEMDENKYQHYLEQVRQHAREGREEASWGTTMLSAAILNELVTQQPDLSADEYDLTAAKLVSLYEKLGNYAPTVEEFVRLYLKNRANQANSTPEAAVPTASDFQSLHRILNFNSENSLAEILIFGEHYSNTAGIRYAITLIRQLNESGLTLKQRIETVNSLHHRLVHSTKLAKTFNTINTQVAIPSGPRHRRKIEELDARAAPKTKEAELTGHNSSGAVRRCDTQNVTNTAPERHNAPDKKCVNFGLINEHERDAELASDGIKGVQIELAPDSVRVTIQREIERPTPFSVVLIRIARTLLAASLYIPSATTLASVIGNDSLVTNFEDAADQQLIPDIPAKPVAQEPTMPGAFRQFATHKVESKEITKPDKERELEVTIRPHHQSVELYEPVPNVAPNVLRRQYHAHREYTISRKPEDEFVELRLATQHRAEAGYLPLTMHPVKPAYDEVRYKFCLSALITVADIIENMPPVCTDTCAHVAIEQYKIQEQYDNIFKTMSVRQLRMELLGRRVNVPEPEVAYPISTDAMLMINFIARSHDPVHLKRTHDTVVAVDNATNAQLEFIRTARDARPLTYYDHDMEAKVTETKDKVTTKVTRYDTNEMYQNYTRTNFRGLLILAVIAILLIALVPTTTALSSEQDLELLASRKTGALCFYVKPEVEGLFVNTMLSYRQTYNCYGDATNCEIVNLDAKGKTSAKNWTDATNKTHPWESFCNNAENNEKIYYTTKTKIATNKFYNVTHDEADFYITKLDKSMYDYNGNKIYRTLAYVGMYIMPIDYLIVYTKGIEKTPRKKGKYLPGNPDHTFAVDGVTIKAPLVCSRRSWGNFTFGHIIALSMGGEDQKTNCNFERSVVNLGKSVSIETQYSKVKILKYGYRVIEIGTDDYGVPYPVRFQHYTVTDLEQCFFDYNQDAPYVEEIMKKTCSPIKCDMYNVGYVIRDYVSIFGATFYRVSVMLVQKYFPEYIADYYVKLAEHVSDAWVYISHKTGNVFGWMFNRLSAVQTYATRTPVSRASDFTTALMNTNPNQYAGTVIIINNAIAEFLSGKSAMLVLTVENEASVADIVKAISQVGPDTIGDISVIDSNAGALQLHRARYVYMYTTVIRSNQLKAAVTLHTTNSKEKALLTIVFLLRNKCKNINTCKMSCKTSDKTCKACEPNTCPADYNHYTEPYTACKGADNCWMAPYHTEHEPHRMLEGEEQLTDHNEDNAHNGIHSNKPSENSSGSL